MDQKKLLEIKIELVNKLNSIYNEVAESYPELSFFAITHEDVETKSDNFFVVKTKTKNSKLGLERVVFLTIEALVEPLENGDKFRLASSETLYERVISQLEKEIMV